MTNSTNPDPTLLAPGPLAADDVRFLFAKAVATGGRAIAAVHPDQLDLPTPCEELDVRRMIQHLIGVLERVAVVGTGASAFTVSGMAGDVLDDALLDAWYAQAHAVQAVWTDDAVLERPVLPPWGPDTGANALARYLNEVTVHTWDLATATGQTPEWDEQVVAVAYDSITTLLPVEGRRAIYDQARASMPPAMAANFKDPFGDPIEAPAGASPIERLVAFSGRRI